MQDHTQPDKRVQKDRRTKATSPLSLSSLFGSRKTIRRKADRSTHHYFDRYSVRWFLTIHAALLLSVADAFFTVKLVSMGAREINPVMNFFFQFGSLPFLLVKYILTGTSLILLLIFRNYLFGGKFRVKYILIAIPIMYTILVIYELFLIL